MAAQRVMLDTTASDRELARSFFGRRKIDKKFRKNCQKINKKRSMESPHWKREKDAQGKGEEAIAANFFRASANKFAPFMEIPNRVREK